MRAAALQLPATSSTAGRGVSRHRQDQADGAGHPPATASPHGQGSYRLLYADTAQTLSWMGDEPHKGAMADVLTLNEQLLLRGYRNSNDTRPAAIQQRAGEARARSPPHGRKSAQIKGF